MAELGRQRVFVYGTLRRGAAQAGRMGGAEWLGCGVVKGDLFRVSWYPGVVLHEEGGCVKGDVFDLDDKLLEQLDEYEGEEYRRMRVEVAGEVAGEAWIWVWARQVPVTGKIVSGDWLEEE